VNDAGTSASAMTPSVADTPEHPRRQEVATGWINTRELQVQRY